MPDSLHHEDVVAIPKGSSLRDRIEIAPAEARTVAAKLVLPGVVEADPARTATVLPPLGGRILELKVALGDRVSRGQVLAVIDSADLAQAYNDYDKALDANRLTEKNLARQEEQFKIGAISARDLDQARSDRAQTSAEFERTVSRLRMLGASTEAKERSRLLTLRAPVSGSITNLSAAAGNMINDPTQALMTVADLSTVWVTAQVPEKDLGSLTRGQEAEVALVAYPDRKFHGKVQSMSDVIEPDSRRNKVRIAFSNPDHVLKPNMFATVTLLGREEARVVIPTSALLINNDRTTVFVEIPGSPWSFERRNVVTQLEEGSLVAIHDGLEAGERVVTKGGILLND